MEVDQGFLRCDRFPGLVLLFLYYGQLEAVSEEYGSIKPHFPYPHREHNPFILCLPVNTSRDGPSKEFCSPKPLLDKRTLQKHIAPE